MSGMIRGAISFALVIEISNNKTLSNLIPIIQLTVLMTMFFYIHLNPSVLNCLLKPKIIDASLLPEGGRNLSFGKGDTTSPMLKTKNMITNVREGTDGNVEHITLRLDDRRGCRKYMFIFSEFMLKPLLIFDYKHKAEFLNEGISEKPLVDDVAWQKTFNQVRRNTTLQDNAIFQSKIISQSNFGKRSNTGKRYNTDRGLLTKNDDQNFLGFSDIPNKRPQGLCEDYLEPLNETVNIENSDE